MVKSGIITRDPKVLGGLPVIKGTRIPVSLLKKLIELGYTTKLISYEYPSLSKEKIEAYKALL